MSSLASILNTSVSGVNASQQALQVTSHNIANANTVGYSRERVDMESNAAAGPSFDGPVGPQCGTGVTVTDISRIRDTFLDYQIRTETSIKGTYDARNNFLGQLQSVMNEPTTSGISSTLDIFFSNWQSLSKNPVSGSTVVAQQTKTLTDALNSTYNQLQTLKGDCQTSIDNTVFSMNDTLDQLDSLNQQIINAKNSGSEPNDLLDKRDTMIDTLSQDFNLNTSSDNKYDGISLQPGDTSGISNPNLVQSENSDHEKRFSYISGIEKVDGTHVDSDNTDTYKITYYKKGDMSSSANEVSVYVKGIDADEYNTIDENRVVWADKSGMAIGLSVDESGNAKTGGTDASTAVDVSNLKLYTPTDGELKGTMTVQSDIDNYTNQMNNLAKAVAFSVNAVEGSQEDSSGNLVSTSDSTPFFVNSSAALYDKSTGKAVLSNSATTLSAEQGITAGNITINQEILDDPTKIKTNTTYDVYGNSPSGDTDGNRALAVANLQNTIMGIQNINSTTTRDAFVGTLTKDSTGVYTVAQESNGSTCDTYFKNTITKIGTQEQQASSVLTTQTGLLQSFTQTRMSESGVSLDEEMTNLIQYQHAYQANAKVISTVSDLLDVIIGMVK
ncbi:MAG: flagellar hook-associated protein FlgK [Clostridium sp.]|nr:flagellar hook-associated protein FlgK [Clostridium sp.]